MFEIGLFPQGLQLDSCAGPCFLTTLGRDVVPHGYPSPLSLQLYRALPPFLHIGQSCSLLPGSCYRPSLTPPSSPMLGRDTILLSCLSLYSFPREKPHPPPHLTLIWEIQILLWIIFNYIPILGTLSFSLFISHRCREHLLHTSCLCLENQNSLKNESLSNLPLNLLQLSTVPGK